MEEFSNMLNFLSKIVKKIPKEQKKAEPRERKAKKIDILLRMKGEKLLFWKIIFRIIS